MTDLAFLLCTALVFLIAGTVKGTVGLGLPTMALALMTLYVDPRTAISIVLFPIVVLNGWQVLRMGQVGRTLTTYRRFAIWTILGVLMSAPLVGIASDRLLLGATGLMLLLFVTVNMFRRPPPIPDALDPKVQIGMGFVSGVMGGLTALWAPMLAIYLAARQVPKDEFVRVSGLIIFLGSLPLAIGYFAQGLMTRPLAGLSLAMLVPSLAGYTCGEYLRRILSVQHFRLVLLWVFLLLGLNLLRRALL